MPEPVRCPACAMIAPIVWVHGHGQCAACGTNVEPCCDGAPLDEQHDGQACANPDLTKDQEKPATDRR